MPAAGSTEEASLPMALPITLPTTCRVCGGAVTIQFQDWEDGHPSDPAVWRCPHCRAEQRLGALGRVVWVMKRRTPPPPDQDQ